MRILFLTPYLPSMIRARSLNFIKELSRRGHSVSIVSLCDAGEEVSPDLADACETVTTVAAGKAGRLANCLRALVSGESLWVASCRSKALGKAVAEQCSSAEYDIVHVEHIRAHTYAKSASAKAMILDAVDCMEPLLLRIAEGKRSPLSRAIVKMESRRVGKREACVPQAFDRVVITSEREKELLAERSPNAVVDVVPIGVDLSEFSIGAKPSSEAKLVFTGKMSYFPNSDAVLWFAREVMPHLLDRYSHLTLTIAGAEPTPEIQALAKHPAIEVTGRVPSLARVLQQSSIAICPLRIAAGAQFKVIEAMASGVPVVASPRAARTISDCPSVLVADSAEDWVSQISRLIESPQEAEELGKQSRAYVEKSFSWKASVDKLEKSYEEAIAHAGRMT